MTVEFSQEKSRRRSLSAALLRSSVLRKAFQNVNATFSVRYVRSMQFTEKFPSLPTRSPTRPKRRTRTKTKKKRTEGCRHRRPRIRFPYRRERPPRWPLYWARLFSQGKPSASAKSPRRIRSQAPRQARRRSLRNAFAAATILLRPAALRAQRNTRPLPRLYFRLFCRALENFLVAHTPMPSRMSFSLSFFRVRKRMDFTLLSEKPCGPQYLLHRQKTNTA